MLGTAWKFRSTLHVGFLQRAVSEGVRQKVELRRRSPLATPRPTEDDAVSVVALRIVRQSREGWMQYDEVAHV